MAVVALVAAVGGVLVTRGDDGEGEPARPATTTTGLAPVAEWKSCTNDRYGFTVKYPPTWFTDAADSEQECRYFDPEPFQAEGGKREIFNATAVKVTVWDSYDDIAGAIRDTDVREDLTIAGRPAVRVEHRQTADEAVSSYHYLVDHDGVGIDMGTAFDIVDPSYAATKPIVDAMAQTLRFGVSATTPTDGAVDRRAAGPPAGDALRPAAVSGSSALEPSASASYEPALVADGRLDTAWCVDGDGVAEHLTLAFGSEVGISAVSIVPGYAKVDPESGRDRWFENRRIAEVAYSFPSEASYQQTFTEARSFQRFVLPSSERATEVNITVTATTGEGDTCISEVQVFGDS